MWNQILSQLTLIYWNVPDEACCFSTMKQLSRHFVPGQLQCHLESLAQLAFDLKGIRHCIAILAGNVDYFCLTQSNFVTEHLFNRQKVFIYSLCRHRLWEASYCRTSTDWKCYKMTPLPNNDPKVSVHMCLLHRLITVTRSTVNQACRQFCSITWWKQSYLSKAEISHGGAANKTFNTTKLIHLLRNHTGEYAIFEASNQVNDKAKASWSKETVSGHLSACEQWKVPSFCEMQNKDCYWLWRSNA